MAKHSHRSDKVPGYIFFPVVALAVGAAVYLIYVMVKGTGSISSSSRRRRAAVAVQRPGSAAASGPQRSDPASEAVSGPPQAPDPPEQTAPSNQARDVMAPEMAQVPTRSATTNTGGTRTAAYVFNRSRPAAPAAASAGQIAHGAEKTSQAFKLYAKAISDDQRAGNDNVVHLHKNLSAIFDDLGCRPKVKQTGKASFEFYPATAGLGHDMSGVKTH